MSSNVYECDLDVDEIKRDNDDIVDLYSLAMKELIEARIKGSESQTYEDYCRICCQMLAEEESVESSGEECGDSFAKIAKNMIDISNGDGLLFKRIIEEGMGPTIPPQSLAIYDYLFYFEGCDEPFDCSAVMGHPEKQRINVGNLIPGVDMALSTMKRGEQAIFVINSSLMFGDIGCVPRIPKQADVFVFIKLIKIVEKNAISDFLDHTKEERRLLPWPDHLSAARQLRKEGSTNFHSKHFANSGRMYSMAIDILTSAPVDNDNDDAVRQEELKGLHLNLAQTYLELGRPRPVITQCNNVLRHYPKDIKALYRKSKALTMLGEYKEAESILKRCLQLDPDNSSILKQIKENNKISLLEKQAFGGMCRQMFKPEVKKGI